MSPTEAPSRWACLTLEFMKTVHLVPRSTGWVDSSALAAKVWTSVFIDAAKVWRNEPQPLEQASLTAMESTAPPLMRRYFMSWPPMSITLVTPGQTVLAAR